MLEKKWYAINVLYYIIVFNFHTPLFLDSVDKGEGVQSDGVVVEFIKQHPINILFYTCTVFKICM